MDIGEKYCKKLFLSSDFELHTVCDLNPKNPKKPKALSAIQVTSDYKEISDDVDIVAPIVPVDLNYFLVTTLDQNKHILLTNHLPKIMNNSSAH